MNEESISRNHLNEVVPLRIFGMTDIGRQRAENQDACLYEQLNDGLSIFVVCDGMGGAQGGKVASEMASRVFIEQLHQYAKPQMSRKYASSVLLNAINFANYEVYQKAMSDENCYGMGTTLVGGFLTGETGMLVNIGDSRAYSIKAEGIVRLTRDHSLVEDLIESGCITREEAKKHPRRNLITRALGTDRKIEADYYPLTIEGQETLLLCSDGLTGMVEDEELARLSTQILDVEECVRAMIETANQNGGSDNITALLLRA